MNRGKMSGILAMALVLGLALSGCATTTVGATDPALHGRWLSEDDGEVEIRLNNDHVKFFLYDLPMARGTYTTSANTITIHFTEIHGAFLSMAFDEEFEDEELIWVFPSSWLTRSQIVTIFENELENMGIPIEDISDYFDFIFAAFDEILTIVTGTYEVSGNILTMTFEGETNIFT